MFIHAGGGRAAIAPAAQIVASGEGFVPVPEPRSTAGLEGGGVQHRG